MFSDKPLSLKGLLCPCILNNCELLTQMCHWTKQSLLQVILSPVSAKLYQTNIGHQIWMKFGSKSLLQYNAFMQTCVGQNLANNVLAGETCYPRPILAFGYCRCLRLSVCASVCVCGNHELVHAITNHPFRLGSPNLDHRCKRPWLRFILFWGNQSWPSRSILT